MTPDMIPQVSIAQYGSIAVAALVCLAVWMKMNSFEKAFAERMKLLIQAGPEERKISPQPLDVRKVEEFATTAALKEHEEEDDAEHKRLHVRVDHNRDKTELLGREVSGISATVANVDTSVRLLNQKIDNFILEARRK